ncbi:MAG: alanine racemase [Thermoleophilia bacterium]|jgi:alanine racemase|nr:alanine racemase [Thermoleophilia bacterium]
MSGLVTPPRAEVRIDLGAYRRNVHALRARLTGGAQLWAVVKANAYGHDVDHVAQEAVAAGARRLCVATLSEARHLRQVGLRVPMLVMGPLDEPSIRRALDLDVSVTVLSAAMADAVERIAHDGSRRGRPARVHLKVDTGMGRWGVPLASAIEQLQRLAELPGVEVEGLMTHFATADELDDDFFDVQLERFTALVAEARSVVDGLTVHAANSAATLRSEGAHFDAVRCGVATYGLDPLQRDASDHGLEPVLTLRSHVGDLRRLEPGDSTGYGRTFIATEAVTVAEVPIGYADGVCRSLSGVGCALVRGVRRPIVGNVSMDHISLVVGDDVEVGDVVTLLGRDGDGAITTEEHARWLDTINYEVTCGLAGEPRLLRVHVGS